ncbi:MAG: ABC transporter ATP-binding protein [Candidatus Sericytochromatia bacterium]
MSLKPLVPFLRPYWPHLAAAALCVAGAAASTMALVPLARRAGEVFGDLTMPALNGVVLGLVGLYALRSACMFGQSALGAYVALQVTAKLREAVYGHLLGLQLRYFRRQRSADLSSRLVQDLGLLKDALAAVLAEILPSVIIIVYALGYVTWLNWRLAIATFIGAPLVAIAIGQFGARLGAIATEIQARVSDVFVRAQESLSAVATVKAFGREAEEARRFEGANRAHLDAHWRGALLQSLQSPTIAVLQTSALAGVLWIGGYEIAHGRMDSADMLAFAAAIGIAIDPTLALSTAWTKVQQALGAARRVFELLEADDRLEEPEGAPPVGPVAGAIACEALEFAYEPGRPVLNGLSLAVAPGEVVALVGPSGGGKSTLAQLIMRLEDPLSGRVTLDGRDLRSIPTPALRKLIAVVSQETVLFAGTIAENVAFGRPEADRQAIESACRAASAHDFIMALPDGYDTPLGERGASLSGGQRQRLAIARALLADPRVLILDEATSALDNQAEEAVKGAIARLMAGRTTIVIAHRMSVIERADRILVVEGGQVVQSGDFESLIAADGAFRRLYEAGEGRPVGA